MKNQCLLLAVLGLLSVTRSFAAPTNDRIEKAAVLDGNYSRMENIDLAGATASALDPLIGGASAGRTVWFIFTASVSGQLTIEIADFDGVRAGLFEARDVDAPAGSLVLRAETKNTVGGDTEVLSANVGAGQRIALMVGGTGKFHLTHRFARGGVPNDFPATAILLNSEREALGGDNLFATITPDEPAMPANFPAMTNTVWYRWTTPFTAIAFVDTNFSSLSSGLPHLVQPWHHTVLVVFREESNGTLTPLASDTDSGYRENSRLSFFALQGRTYLIGVGTVPGQVPGDFQLNVYRGNSAGEILLPYSGDLGTRREGEAPLEFVVRRRFANSQAASCKISTNNAGTATPFADYLGFSQTISFDPANGDEAWELRGGLAIINDAVAEPMETVGIELTMPSAGATVKGGTRFVNILDRDYVGPASTFSQTPIVRVRENAGQAQVILQRGGSTSDFETLALSFNEGTAQLGQDFSADNSFGFFLPGQSVGSAAIAIINDTMFEPEEQFTLKVNGIAQCIITIEDDDLYLPVPGRFTSVLGYAGDARSALLSVAMTSTGGVTGKVMLGGQTLAFKSQLDDRGRASVTLLPAIRPALILTIEAWDTQGAFRLALFDTATQAQTTANARVQTFRAKTNPCPLAGAFTTRVQGQLFQVLPTVAVASVTVSASGATRVTGMTYDNRAFTSAAQVDGNGALITLARVPGRGTFTLSGALPVMNGATGVLAVRYNFPARANDPAVLGPLLGDAAAGIVRYTPPSTGQRVIDVWDASGGVGKATLSGADLPMPIAKALAISTANVIAAPADAEQLKVKAMTASGLFRGSFVPTAGAPPRKFTGVFQQFSGGFAQGLGCFTDGVKGGSVRLFTP